MQNKPKEKKSLGQKVVEWLPSQHPDREKAREQERGLQGFIDFVVPQSKTDVALSFIPFIGKGGKPIVRGMREQIKTMKKWRDVPMSRQIDMDEWKSGGWYPRKSMLEGKEWIENWYNTFRGPKVEKLKSEMSFQRKKPEAFDPLKHSSVEEANKGRISLDDVELRARTDISGPYASYHYRPELVSAGKSGIAHSPEINKVLLNDRFTNLDILRQTAILNNLTHKQFIKSLGVHEYGHALNWGSEEFLGKGVRNLIKNAIDKSQLSQGAQVLPGHTYREMGGEMLKIDRKRHRYLSEPQEISRRIDQLRFELGEDPVRLTKQWVNLRKMDALNQPYTDLRRVLSHNQIEQLYNKLPALLPFGFAPALKGKDDKNRKY